MPVVHVRFTDQELDEIRALASGDDRALSTMIRKLTLQAKRLPMYRNALAAYQSNPTKETNNA